MDPETISKIEQECSTAAKEFTKLFYNQMDKTRHLVGKLYLTTGVLIWNENITRGDEQIQKFILELPASEHIINTLNAQPLLNYQQTLMIQVKGTVKFQDYQDKPEKAFHQTFMIIAQADKWKIVNSSFSFLEPAV